jgi:hypothetical protein
MEKKYTFLLIFSTLLLALFFQACKKDQELASMTEQEEVSLIETTLSAEDQQETEVQALNHWLTESNSTPSAPPCAIVTRNADTRTVTIDFGSGCTSVNGIVRSGRAILTFSRWNDTMAQRTLTFENYKVQGRGISGAVELHNFSRNTSGNLTVSRTLKDYTISYLDGTTHVLNGTQTRELLSGEGEADFNKYKVQLTGYFEGVSSKGMRTRHTITEPVIVDFGCAIRGNFARVAGKTEIQVSNLRNSHKRLVNYGDGTCDKEYTITLHDGRVIVITKS